MTRFYIGKQLSVYSVCVFGLGLVDPRLQVRKHQELCFVIGVLQAEYSRDLTRLIFSDLHQPIEVGFRCFFKVVF